LNVVDTNGITYGYLRDFLSYSHTLLVKSTETNREQNNRRRHGPNYRTW